MKNFLLGAVASKLVLVLAYGGYWNYQDAVAVAKAREARYGEVVVKEVHHGGQFVVDGKCYHVVAQHEGKDVVFPYVSSSTHLPINKGDRGVVTYKANWFGYVTKSFAPTQSPMEVAE